jgi:hypothetical protein
MSNRRKLQKRLTYRVQGAVNLANQTAHWDGFTWSSGPWQVISDGVWGRIQVWASSPNEGKRVIRHAAAVAGVDPDDTAQAVWVVNEVTDPRYGAVRTMGLRRIRGLPCVSSRNGPSGAPNWDV